VAGRLMLSRPQGKLAFAELRDASGSVQLFALAP
jgi:lysyl-tRNA synthetase class II